MSGAYERYKLIAARSRARGDFDAAAAIEDLLLLADDALALLDQHISEEQRKELGRRIIERLTSEAVA